MIKKLNNIISVSMIGSLIVAMLGLIIVIFPNVSMSIISYTLAFSFIILGLFLVIKFNNNVILDFLSIGIIDIVLGIILIIYPKTLETIIPIILGIWMIISSIFKIKLAVVLKNVNNNVWLVILLLNVLIIFCGIGLVINPEVGALTITTMIGFLMIVYSVSDLADCFIIKNHIKAIIKYFDK